MSIEILRSKNQLIAEHCTTLDFPIQYALVQNVTPGVPFEVLIYHDRKNFRFSERSPASDMPFAVWKPAEGLKQLCHEPFYTLCCARLLPEIESFCEAAFTAYQE